MKRRPRPPGVFRRAAAACRIVFAEAPQGWYFETRKSDRPDEFLIVEVEKSRTDSRAPVPVILTLKMNSKITSSRSTSMPPPSHEAFSSRHCNLLAIETKPEKYKPPLQFLDHGGVFAYHGALTARYYPRQAGPRGTRSNDDNPERRSNPQRNIYGHGAGWPATADHGSDFQRP